MLDDIESRPNEQVIGVSQNNLCIQFAAVLVGLTPFTEPCVPTGMNAGVSIMPCTVVNRPRLALDN